MGLVDTWARKQLRKGVEPWIRRTIEATHMVRLQDLSVTSMDETLSFIERCASRTVLHTPEKEQKTIELLVKTVSAVIEDIRREQFFEPEE